MLGDAGRIVNVNILYRSKRALPLSGPLFLSYLTYGIGILQMLGCIPRTPSPVPLPNNLEEAVIKPDDPQEQLRALRVSVRGMTYPAALC